jgi:uncharacterized repeat protein (TIGR04076 family)
MKLHPVRITVLKRLLIPEAVARCAANEWGACTCMTEGQEFLVDGSCVQVPPGFCAWAWADLHKYLVTLARGGNFSGSLPGKTVVSCTDGYRPVIFALERIEDEG